MTAGELRRALVLGSAILPDAPDDALVVVRTTIGAGEMVVDYHPIPYVRPIRLPYSAQDSRSSATPTQAPENESERERGEE